MAVSFGKIEKSAAAGGQAARGETGRIIGGAQGSGRPRRQAGFIKKKSEFGRHENAIYAHSTRTSCYE